MEQPNIQYIKEIANGNEDFEARLIEVIKSEFPEEIKAFRTHYNAGNFKTTAECVHKIKHKINILGLSSGYELAVQFEEELKKGMDTSYPKFMSILDTMDSYIKLL